MHSVVYRANALGTYAVLLLLALSMGASLSDYWHAAQPEVKLRLRSVEKMGRLPDGNDAAYVTVDLDADLRPIFSWNTKQLFVTVVAEYATPANQLNQVCLWDRVVENRESARVKLPYLRNKYRLVDQGAHLKGRDLNLTLTWSVMPKSGGIYSGQARFPGFRLDGAAYQDFAGGRGT